MITLDVAAQVVLLQDLKGHFKKKDSYFKKISNKFSKSSTLWVFSYKK